MNVILSISLFVLTLFGVSHGYYSRLRQPMHNIYQDSRCSCSCEDISSLLTIVRALEGKESNIDPVITNDSNFNAEDLVMKLVNALIQITTQALAQSKCHCPSSCTTVTDGTNNINPTVPSLVGSSSYNSEGGLVNFDLLNQKKTDNSYNVDLSKQYITSVGSGEGSSNVNSHASNDYTIVNEYRNSNGRNAIGGNNDDHPTNVMPIKHNNDGQVIQPKNTGATASGGSAAASSSSTSSTSNVTVNETKTKPITTGEISGSLSGEGSIKSDLLNLKKTDKAELDLSSQNVFGIGLGKNGALSRK